MVRLATLAVPMAVVLSACASGGGGGDNNSDVPTYWADVRPIIDETCARCHREGGQAPVSFDDVDDVVALAPLMAARIAAGEMPPSAPDPACADYEGSDGYTLDDVEKATIQAWVDGGTPLGDEADRPNNPPPPETLAPWDREVRGAGAYTPTFAPGNPNDYRCWAIDVGNEEETYLTGLEAIVDNPTFVHHVVLFDDGQNLLGGDDAWSGGADPNDADGFPCDGFGEGDWSFLHGWGPGARPMQFPDGFGMRLQPRAKLVIQAHYFDNGEVGPDAVGYGLQLADQVATEVYDIPVYPDNFDYIPAGDADYTVGAAYSLNEFGIPLNITVLSVWPHMHVLGTGFDYKVLHDDGTETCVVHEDGWAFHNQVPVNLATPIVVKPTDTISIECRYDNSANNPNQVNDPPADVYHGEGTTDEMCFGFTYAYVGPF